MRGHGHGSASFMSSWSTVGARVARISSTTLLNWPARWSVAGQARRPRRRGDSPASRSARAASDVRAAAGPLPGRATIRPVVVVDQEVTIAQHHEVDLGAHHGSGEAGGERVEGVLRAGPGPSSRCGL